MVVAAGALHREPLERVHHRREDVVAVEVAADFAVDRVFADVAERAFIPRPRREETQSRREFRLLGKQYIGGDLFLGELRKRCVRVERADEVVAVAPGVGPHAILIVAVRLGEMHEVHPLPGHAFAVVRRREQLVDEFLVGLRRGVVQERVDLRGRRRQADEVEVEPPNQRPLVCLRRRREPFLVQLRQHEPIDWILEFELGTRDFRNRGLLQGSKRPPDFIRLSV